MAKSNTRASAVVNRYADSDIQTEATPVGEVSLLYDYETEVEPEHRDFLKDAAREIHIRRRQAVRDMLVIGRLLNEAKKRLPGKFNAWVQREFDMSLANVSELRNMADRFSEEDTIIVQMQPTIVRLLAAPSVPDEVITKVKRLAEKAESPGEVKVKDARAIWDEHRLGVRQNGERKKPTPTVTIEAEYAIEPLPTVAPTPERAELRKRSVVPAYIQPKELKSGELGVVLLSASIGRKLHAAVLIHSLRFHLSAEEQAELQFALEEAFPQLGVAK